MIPNNDSTLKRWAQATFTSYVERVLVQVLVHPTKYFLMNHFKNWESKSKRTGDIKIDKLSE